MDGVSHILDSLIIDVCVEEPAQGLVALFLETFCIVPSGGIREESRNAAGANRK